MPSVRPPWWIYVIAASFLAHFALLTYSAFWGVQVLGVDPLYTEGRMVLRSVESGSPAQQAGLRPDDQILTVNGLAVRNRLDWVAIAANFEAGRPQRLEIERAGKRLELAVTLRQRAWKDWDATGLLMFCAIRGAQLALLLLAFLIVFNRPYDLVARVGALFLAGVSLGWPTIPYGMAVTWRHLPFFIGGLLWVAEVGAFAASPMLFTFFAIFPRVLFRPRWAWALAWLPGLAVTSLSLFYVYRVLYQPEHATGVADWAFPFFLWVAVTYILAGVVASVANYRRLEEVNERRRMRVLVVGSFVGLGAVLPSTMFSLLGSSSGILARFFTSLPALLVAILLLQAFPLSFAYALLRHRPFDIRVMIRQGVQYALARGLLKSLVPALIGIFFLEMFMHADQPLIYIIDPKYGRGWLYALLAGLAFWAHKQRQSWMEALDRRFFRERYDAQRLLHEVVEEVRKAGSFDRVAPRVVARIEEALHPEFAALMVREPREPAYRALAASPAGQAPPPLASESKLIALVRVLGKPLEMPHTESGWLQQQLPHEETDFLRRARIDLLVPIATAADRKEALLALGVKRSEEPYTREDQDLLVAVAASLALLLERPVEAPARVSEAFEECPKCGTCYDTGASRCAQEGASLIPIRLPRQLVGRYRLERRRGRGGMGAVYEATDTALERRVAVKVIRDDLVGSEDAAERFRREARAAASFAHPNVVTVFDFGVAADMRAFLVMELLEGGTLREELGQKKRLAASRTLEILRGVCAAVDAAHRRQLIHRDLKPENIFLARNESAEVAKVLDFGIAKFLPAATQATADTGSTVLVGTLFYMSPEQLRADPAQPAWDVWALAVVAYEMLTGARPFAGTSSGELHSAILSGRVTPVPIHVPEAPGSWQEFFVRALALEPSRRPSSATTFFSELQQALS